MPGCEDKSIKNQEKVGSFFQQKNNYLANCETKSKEENEKHYKLRHYGTIRNVLWHCIKTAVQVNDGFHDYKINISSLKKQGFNGKFPIFIFHMFS
jgi:hypothetical protein